MISFDIRININKIKNYSKTLRPTVDDETLSLMISSFSTYVKNLYGRMIEEAMNSRRYRGKWEPVDDPNYVEYIGTKPEVPIIDLLGEALEVKRVGYNYIIRIDPRYKYPGSKLTLLHVVRSIENGTSDFHARPILYKVSKDIQRRIFDLWRGFLLMKRVI